jgi:hypothetical protein
MTEHERDALADAIAERLHRGACPMGWTNDDAALLRRVAGGLRLTVSIAWQTLIGLAVAGVGVVVVLGVVSWIRKAVQ